MHDDFPSDGFVRLKDIIAPWGPIPVSRSTWWAGVKSGRFPKPVTLNKGVTAWRVSDVEALWSKQSYTVRTRPIAT